jgi:cytochrome c oxidase assembly protein subunit 15
LFYTWIHQKGFEKHNTDLGMRKMILWTLSLTGLQVIFGGFVSGMKSSLSYPTWPLMNKQWIPSLLLDRTHWNIDNFLLYDKSGFMPALVLFIHRNIAYLLLVLFVFLAVKWYKENEIKWRWVSFFLLCSVVVQISLGILTLVNSIGHIPALLGSLHQGVGIITITFLFYMRLVIKPENITK